MSRVTVMLAVNDPRNGMMTDHCLGVGIDCVEVEIDCNVRFKDAGKGFIGFGKLTVKYYGSREWVGNWCWDAYILEVKDVAKILEYLRKHDLGDIQVGATELYDAWNNGKPLLPVLEQLLKAEQS